MNTPASILPSGDDDIVSYRPKVSKATGEWFISPTDLLFILEGTGILGTGSLDLRLDWKIADSK